jgi:RNA polymerase sigma-70 factor, ECF subfamily
MVPLVSLAPDPPAVADARLMQRVACHDKQAQREVAERLAPRVRRLCKALIEDSADADDAAQQALVEILQSAGTFQAEGRLEGWADTVTARTALRHAKKIRARRSIFEQVAQPERIASIVGDLRNKSATPRQLEGYLAQLSAEKRESFVLKHALGYTVDEIAALTDSPRGTVKDRLIAARRQLRKLIGKELPSTNRGKP